MDEKLSYEDMLDMPVSSSIVLAKKTKKKKTKTKKVDTEQVKAELVDKVNSNFEEQEDAFLLEQTDQLESSVNITTSQKVKRFKFSILSAQILVIGVLVATIFITNSVSPNSGLNLFMRNIFGSQQQDQVDTREFSDFAPVLSIGEGNIVLNEGIMTISNAGSIYSACNGRVSSLTRSEDGKFTMEIEHNKNFTSVLSGLDYAYSQVGEMVYTNIPVGYVSETVEMCFKGQDGLLIDDFTLENNSIIWSV